MTAMPRSDHDSARPGQWEDTMLLGRIATVRSSRTEPLDDDWDAVPAQVVLDDALSPSSLLGLQEFSHIEVVYVFHRVQAEQVQTAARRPRGNPKWPEVGIFAQRAKARPNRLGVTVCRLLRVDGRTLHVQGLDAIDGTPVVDLKPYFAEFGPRGEVRQPAWSHELMAGYWTPPGPGDA
jgi:tRNA-Thr(GGU) m(6)t(6)A37 methyltransferase TsaA